MSTTKTPDPKRTRALLANYRRCTMKEHHENVRFIMTGDVAKWYFLLGAIPGVSEGATGEFPGEVGEFIGGQYLGVITATDKYPYGPPNVLLLTPTGVFPVNDADFCINIGRYHASDYPATLGMDGFVKTICSGLQGWRSLGKGIALKKYASEDEQRQAIQKYASDSQAYNHKHHEKILAMFKDQYVLDGRATAVEERVARKERAPRTRVTAAESTAAESTAAE